MLIINDAVDKFIEKKNTDKSVEMKRELKRFWPTECSCNVCGKTQGKCSRELYYSSINTPITNPINARGLRICDAGNMYEDKEIERVKNVEYYKDSAVKFKFIIPDTSITIAGKLDLIYNINNKLIGGEIKSGYGYMFKQSIFDTASTPGMPMIKHLMQVMMYLYYFKYVDTQTGIDEFYMTYIDRGDCENTQFSIKLSDSGYPIIKNSNGESKYMYNINTSNPLLFNQNIKGKRDQNKIDKTFNKLKYYEISIENIFNRFKRVANYIDNKELPPKDYKYMYTSNEIEEAYNQGDLAKSTYEKAKETGIHRDFQCTYCNYLKKCISDDGEIKFKNNEDEHL